MKVAFFVGKFPELSETFILNQITGLLDRGYEVDVYGWPSEDPQSHDDVAKYALLERTYTAPSLPESYVRRTIKGIGVLGRLLVEVPQVIQTLDVLRYGRLAASLRLLYASKPHALKRREVYDIAHCHFGQNGILALALRELDLLHARRIITTFHGHDVYVDVPRFSGKLRRLLFENGDAFTVNSSYTLDNVIELGGQKQDIYKLPVGLDVDKFDFQPSVRNSGEPVHILTVGRLVEKKGIKYAIRAIAQLKDDFDVMYRIVGDGPLRGQLEQLVQQLGAAENITFLGALPEAKVREQYQWAHLFTLPSVTASDGDREGQGLVLQEAQVCGLPVVTTRHNGLPDGVKEGESAILVPERDTDALANALQTLVRQESSWPEMGRAGRTFVEENYDIEVLNDRLVSLYRDLLDNDD